MVIRQSCRACTRTIALSHVATKGKGPLITNGRFMSTAARGYSEALEKLFKLQPNRKVTNLFENSSSGKKSSPQDLNAAAIPEVLTWLRRAGYTQRDLAKMRHIHVAGTKGKGSVCAYATAMLMRYRTVGTYTSPHLVSPRERIAINGNAVGQDVFAEAFFEVWDRFTEAAVKEGMTAAEAEGPASKPFFFRYLTILAWHIFLREGVTDVVMECGIGGEYDATNVLPPEAVSAAVVTQLGVDHVAMLGDTVEKISWHKAGILKPGVRGFTMRLDDQPSVMEVLRTRAEEKGTELVELDSSLVEKWGGVSGILKGDFQKRNQALAVMAVSEHLGMSSSPATALENIPDKMVRGLREARLRGRCEVVDNGDVVWLLDGAHTKDSLEEVAKWFAKSLDGEEDVILVFNQQERNAAELLGGFLEAVKKETKKEDVFRHAIFTRNELATPAEGEVRDLDVQRQAAERMSALVPESQVKVFDNLGDSVAETRKLAWVGDGAKKQKVLVTGSLHLVGGIAGSRAGNTIVIILRNLYP
ncbi:Folylpolyglutamate synthase [Cladobotryum mycophilum]|uniref:Folylpolyglutamate synthase n=1 Tax=Cladobotryum mycophilum TaxID=491253 RepID=A0ABR0SKN4_9HYPO